MAKGEDARRDIQVVMKNLAPDVDLHLDEIPGGFRCTLQSNTACHRFRFDEADLNAFQTTEAARDKIQQRLADELDCLRMKEKIKGAAAPLYPDNKLVFGGPYDRDQQVRVEVGPQGAVPSYSAMGPDELTALKKLLTEIERAARTCSP